MSHIVPVVSSHAHQPANPPLSAKEHRERKSQSDKELWRKLTPNDRYDLIKIKEQLGRKRRDLGDLGDRMVRLTQGADAALKFKDILGFVGNRHDTTLRRAAAAARPVAHLRRADGAASVTVSHALPSTLTGVAA